jgi:hypothetical protein
MRAILKLPRSPLANLPANMGVMQQLVRFLPLRSQRVLLRIARSVISLARIDERTICARENFLLF